MSQRNGKESRNMMERINTSLIMDFYELTMANGYFEEGLKDQIAYFDIFYRSVPDEGGFAIMAGLEQAIRCMQEMKFDDKDIAFLRGKGIFSEGFLEYLRNFEFQCDVWAIPEGTPIFPGEPVMTVRGPAIQAQLLETILLICINHESLIATKANRIVRAAAGRAVMEFGSRRAHGTSAAVQGARAAYIGGCAGTACASCERDFGIPALGTMAHSWVQMFDNEYDAFTKYAQLYPDNCVLLIDTYNVLKSGLPTAIRVFKEQKPAKMGVRMDSGDLTYLSKQARKVLDEAGLQDCKIVASNAFDEYLIQDVISQGACIDSFGVGERLITARSEAVFGGVYKLAALESPDGTISPKIKISENVSKITNPGFKKVYRYFDRATGKAMADLIALYDEEISGSEPITLFDPVAPWKKKTLKEYTVKELQVPIFEKGTCVYESPDIKEIQKYCKEQVETLYEEVLRFENPHTYYVDLTEKLWNLRKNMIEGSGK